MARRIFNQRRFDVGTGLERVRAACHELAADGQRMDVRHRAGYDGQAMRLRALYARNRSEQAVCVGVKGRLEQRVDTGNLLNLSAVHYGHAVARLSDDRQVVRDRSEEHTSELQSL